MANEEEKKEASEKAVDYQANSRKSKETLQPGTEPEKLDKIIVGEVMIPKKSFTRKTKDLLVEADFKSVVRYLFMDVLVPATKNTIVDMTTQGIQRMVYGDKAIRSRNSGIFGESRGTYVSYNNPIHRANAIDVTRRGGPNRDPRETSDRQSFILSRKDDADRIIEEIGEMIDVQGYVTLATLKERLGYPSTHVDYNWGWQNMMGVISRQVREGYLIDFPPPRSLT